MRQASNQTIYDLIDALAPFETQEGFDNAGFLIGDRSRPVSRVLVALDASLAVVEEARTLKADLLITHHPVMFRAVKSLDFESHEARLLSALLRADLSLIAAHTNLDQSPISAGFLLAERLRLSQPRALEGDPFLVLGDVAEAQSSQALVGRLAEVLGGPVRIFGDRQARVQTLAIAGGAYCDGWLAAKRAGADALLTGEVRHHNALAAVESGFVIFDGGHFQTEVCMVEALREYLQTELNALQYEVEVYASAAAHGAEGYVLKEEA